MTNKEQAKVVRDIADEIQIKGWWNPRLNLGNDSPDTVCVAIADASYGKDTMSDRLSKILGVHCPTAWNDSHDTVESLLADLRARADFLDAAPETEERS